MTDQEKIRELRLRLRMMLDLHNDMMNQVNHGESFYTAGTIQRMNEVPAKAEKTLEDTK